MSATRRLPAADRRAAILKAVLPVFARKGLAGATTKELAAAAGVSEALLFRHFESKEALHDALGEAWIAERESHPGLGKLLAMPPGAKKLVRLVAYLVEHMANEEPGHVARLLARSLLADGTFARGVLDRIAREWLPLFTESIRAAADAGDLQAAPDAARLGVWFSHHLGWALALTSLPEDLPSPYGRSRETVISEATRFSLRGLGLPPALVEQELTRPPQTPA